MARKTNKTAETHRLNRSQPSIDKEMHRGREERPGFYRFVLNNAELSAESAAGARFTRSSHLQLNEKR